MRRQLVRSVTRGKWLEKTHGQPERRQKFLIAPTKEHQSPPLLGFQTSVPIWTWPFERAHECAVRSRFLPAAIRGRSQRLLDDLSVLTQFGSECFEMGGTAHLSS
jgi:hypothetical protein